MTDRSLLRSRLALLVGEEPVDAELADYSTEGARLRLDRPVKIGTVVRLVVGTDEFRGVVRYCTVEPDRAEYTVGVRFSIDSGRD
jgi:hypothetical protein